MLMCVDCGFKHKFTKLLKIDYESSIYLPCDNCKKDLVDKGRYFPHIMITGVIFVLFIFLESYFNSVIVHFLSSVLIPCLYYILFLPIRKKYRD